MPCSVKQVVDGPQGQAELEEHPGVVLGAVGRAGLGFAKALPQAVDLEGQHLVLALEVAEVGGAPHVRLGRHLLDADLLDCQRRNKKCLKRRPQNDPNAGNTYAG